MKRTVLLLFFLITPVLVWCAGAAGKEVYPYKEIGDGGPAVAATLTLIDGIALGPDGSIYISHRSKNRIRKIDPRGIITTVAGKGDAGFSGDGGPALQATLNFPAGLALDREGNLYVADRNNHRVRRIDPRGIITTVAGNGVPDMEGDEGPATEASLNFPSDLVCDDHGNLYISDRSNNRIRKVDPQGIITTVAGLGLEGFGGDFGPAEDAFLKFPFGITLDKQDNLYIADRGNNRIRKVDTQGIITTVAGDGMHAFGGDYGPAGRASLAYPTDVAVDDGGIIYIADRNNNRIRKIDSFGIITTVAGTGHSSYNGDNEIPSETNLHLPFALAIDRDHSLLIVDRSNFRVRRMNLQTGTVVTVAGNGESLFKGDGGPGRGANLDSPSGLVVDSHDNILFTDKQHHRLRRIDTRGTISTLAGNGFQGTEGNGGPADKAELKLPSALTIDREDNIYMAARAGSGWVIRKIGRDGIITRFAGNGKLGTGGDNGPALEASFFALTDMVMGPRGNLYIADRSNRFIRKIDKNGIISRVAEENWGKLEGQISPSALAVDAEGNIFVSDGGSSKIRRIDPQGRVTTFAGNGDFRDEGDGGPALAAGIRSPSGLAVSPGGELYIAEERSSRIRKIDKNGIITRVAGTGVAGYSGEGGPAADAQLKSPFRMAFDSGGNLIFTDRDDNLIRKIDRNGIITTVAGNKNIGWMQDGLEVRIMVHNFP